MTYLEIVNKVLLRLRESSVTSVSSSDYSQLIGEFVNDTKAEIENAFTFDQMSVTIPITTIAGTSSYTVTGSGRYQRGEAFNDTTNKVRLIKKPLQWIIDQQQLTTVQQGIPGFYAWNGNNGTDSKIILYPTPNSVFTIQANMYVNPVDLSSDTDIPAVDSTLIVLGAYARALVERGEDGGLQSSEAYQLFRSRLSDAIAIEANRFIENDCWEAI